VQGDWALLCVLGEKAGTKEASNGKRYGIWTLCDLEGTCTKLFLFGDAFAEHWKESEASILALLAPKVKAEGGAVTLTVDQPAQLFKLGTAADFALCKADRKDGRPCSMVVNARVCEFCPFHAGAALKAMGQNKGGRMELSGGNASFSLRKRMLAASAGAAGRGLFGIPMGSRGAGAHAAGGGVRAPPAAQRNSAEEMQRVAAGGFGKANSAGSRYLLNVAAPPQPPQPAAASTASGAARGVAAMVQAMGVQARMRLTGSSQRPQFVAGPQAQARAAVRLVETDIFDDDGDDAMARAGRHCVLLQR
jgi:minichromosome maintenance protein 10